MKKYIISICCIIGAIIWSIIAWTCFPEDKTGWHLFYVFRVVVPGILFAVITIALVALLIWITWIRPEIISL